MMPVFKTRSPIPNLGDGTWEIEKVHKCIADIVWALQVDGLFIKKSTCGRGRRDGKIMLMDGRELIVKHGTGEVKDV